ncbi:hypothetical protein [Neptuniibacter sp. QD37_11]|uniref:hypothetical protein n=1 Tax=Neptuniibacter sp. QD37_11 TaxID=3398209 RepID=UPI0039F509FE
MKNPVEYRRLLGFIPLPILIKESTTSAVINTLGLLAIWTLLCQLGIISSSLWTYSFYSFPYFWTVGSPAEVDHYQNIITTYWISGVALAIILLNVFTHKSEGYKIGRYAYGGAVLAVILATVLGLVQGFDWEGFVKDAHSGITPEHTQSFYDNGTRVLAAIVMSSVIGYLAYKRYCAPLKAILFIVGYVGLAPIFYTNLVTPHIFSATSAQHFEEDGYVYPVQAGYCTHGQLRSVRSLELENPCWAHVFLKDGEVQLSKNVSNYLRARRGSFVFTQYLADILMPQAKTEQQRDLAISFMESALRNLDHAVRIPRDPRHKDIVKIPKHEDDNTREYGFMMFNDMWLGTFTKLERPALEYNLALLDTLKQRDGEAYWGLILGQYQHELEGSTRHPTNLFQLWAYSRHVISWGLLPTADQMEALQTLYEKAQKANDHVQYSLAAEIQKLTHLEKSKVDSEKWADIREENHLTITWPEIIEIEAKLNVHGFNLKGLDK